MKKIFILLMCFNCTLTIIAQNTYEVTVKVVSKSSGVAIQGATVDIIGSGKTETGKDGNTFFSKVEEDIYEIEISKSGYYTETIQKCKVNEPKNAGDNIWKVELREIQTDLFEIKGRVKDEDNQDINNAEVHIAIGDKIGVENATKTNKYGYYKFKFKKEEIKTESDFIISVRKDGYLNPPDIRGGFNRNFIDDQDFILKKIIEPLTADTISSGNFVQFLKNTVKPKNRFITIGGILVLGSGTHNTFVWNKWNNTNKMDSVLHKKLNLRYETLSYVFVAGAVLTVSGVINRISKKNKENQLARLKLNPVIKEMAFHDPKLNYQTQTKQTLAIGLTITF